MVGCGVFTWVGRDVGCSVDGALVGGGGFEAILGAVVAVSLVVCFKNRRLSSVGDSVGKLPISTSSEYEGSGVFFAVVGAKVVTAAGVGTVDVTGTIGSRFGARVAGLPAAN